MRLTNNQKLVIKACKGHFKTSDDYKFAEYIIQRLVYNHPKSLLVPVVVKYLREIIQTAQNRDLESWTHFNNRMFDEIEKGKFWNESYDFVVVRFHLSTLAGLLCRQGDKVILELDDVDTSKIHNLKKEFESAK